MRIFGASVWLFQRFLSRQGMGGVDSRAKRRDGKMRRTSIFAALLLLFTSSTIGEAASAPAPVAGVYATAIAIEAVKGSICPNTLGAQLAGIVDWGGITSKTITARIPIASYAPSFGIVAQQVLTITQGLGTTSESGTFQTTEAGIEAPFSKLNGEFAMDLIYIDTNSFAMDLVEEIPSISCSEILFVALTHVS